MFRELSVCHCSTENVLEIGGSRGKYSRGGNEGLQKFVFRFLDHDIFGSSFGSSFGMKRMEFTGSLILLS